MQICNNMVHSCDEEKSLNNDGHQFHQYQQYEKSSPILTELTEHK
jgi:hypothetical protein